MENISTKLFYKIAEASELLDVPASTLRFWEKEFKGFICPKRSDGGTRYFSADDIEKLRMIKFLIKDRGLKIEAARQEIRLNRDGVVKRAEAVRTLASIRDRLQGLIDSMQQFR